VQRARVVNVPRWAFLIDIVAAQAGGDEEDDEDDEDDD
jgi:hypothetical protein